MRCGQRPWGFLVRLAPEPVEAAENEGAAPSSRASGSRKLLYQRATVKERATQWEERRWETRGADGEIRSSESERRENVHERTVTRDLGPKEQGVNATDAMGWEDKDDAPGQREKGLLLDSVAPGRGTTDEDAVKEIAFEETASSDRGRAKSDGKPPSSIAAPDVRTSRSRRCLRTPRVRWARRRSLGPRRRSAGRRF